jgi:hypothetical protein
MPDRAGRPTFNDWAQVSRGIANIRNDEEARAERRADQQRRGRIDGYLNMIGRGEAPDPKAPDYNYADHLAASAVHMRGLMADETFKTTQLANHQAQAEMLEKDVKAQLAQAQYFYYRAQGASDPAAKKRFEDQAYDALLPIYEYYPDGNKNPRWKGDDRSKLVFTDVQGNEFEHPAPTLDEAMQQAEGFSKNYVQGFLKKREWINEKNVELQLKYAQDPKLRQVTADGREAIYEGLYGMDAKGDLVLVQSWSDPKTGKVLKGFDTKTGKEVKSNLDFRSREYFQSVKKLDDTQRRAWEKAYEQANKEWAEQVKEGVIDPADPATAEARTAAQIEHYRRLAPNAPLPEGVVDPRRAGFDKKNWHTYDAAPAAAGMGTTAVPEKKTAQDATPALQAAHAPVAAPTAAPKGIVGTAAADGGAASGAGPAQRAPAAPVRNAAREAAKARVKKVWDYKGIAGN